MAEVTEVIQQLHKLHKLQERGASRHDLVSPRAVASCRLVWPRVASCDPRVISRDLV